MGTECFYSTFQWQNAVLLCAFSIYNDLTEKEFYSCFSYHCDINSMM